MSRIDESRSDPARAASTTTPGVLDMDTFLQMAVAFGALSGWGAVIFGIAWHVSAQRRELFEAREARSRQRRALQLARARLEAIEGRHRRQLEQTRILFEIEEVLAERLAEAQGGAARTRKIEARFSSRALAAALCPPSTNCSLILWIVSSGEAVSSIQVSKVWLPNPSIHLATRIRIPPSRKKYLAFSSALCAW